MTRRVAVTGIGLVSSLGLSTKATWEGLLAGRSGIARITHFDPSDFAADILETVREEGGGQALFAADVIITGGRPCGELDGLELVQELAEALKRRGLKAEWGATRQAVDNGFAPYARQIGQTGKTVRPRVYVAAAVSGAIQHLMGIAESNKIVAVNRDSQANIFKSADFGIVGDYLEVFPDLIKKVEQGFTFGLTGGWGVG